MILALQLFWAAAGVFPQVRRRLRVIPWFVAIMIGPPLLWVLTATSVGLIQSVDGLTSHAYGFSMARWFGWLLKEPAIIGTTCALQMILAWEYTETPLRSLPLFGSILGLVAILGDLIFVLWAITPP